MEEPARIYIPDMPYDRHVRTLDRSVDRVIEQFNKRYGVTLDRDAAIYYLTWCYEHLFEVVTQMADPEALAAIQAEISRLCSSRMVYKETGIFPPPTGKPVWLGFDKPTETSEQSSVIERGHRFDGYL